MDLVTHAVSGALIAFAIQPKPQTRFFVPLLAFAACAPDLDILFCRTPELFLALHRGISHSLFALPFFAFVLAVLFRFLWAKTGALYSRKQVYFACASCLGLHLWLDCLCTYGTMLFLPFSSYRVRLNTSFILDPFLLIVLLILLLTAVFWKNSRRLLACLALGWCFLWPSLCLGLQHLCTENFRQELLSQERKPTELILLPDFFTPLYWRALYLDMSATPTVCEQSLGYLGQRRGPANYEYPVAVESLRHLKAQSQACRSFLDFMMLPTHGVVSAQEQNEALQVLGETNPEQALIFREIHDLRFGSGLHLGKKLLSLRPNAASPFRLLLLTDSKENIVLERLIFSDSHKDTGWKKPTVPAPPSFLSWLVGLH